jgi:glycosyltransferase involved in cell wall biosynthesis
VLELAFGVPRERTSVVPLGLADAFLAAGPGQRNKDYVICVGTITRQKNSVPLARLARQIQVPLLFVGQPYSETDACWQEFKTLIDGRWVRHQPHVHDPREMISLLQQARGAVVASDFENWSFTAHEAAACGLPLLLPAQNWARECFGNQAQYFSGNIAHAGGRLREFYDQCPDLPALNIRHYRWTEIAAQLRNIYTRVLKSPTSV